MKAKDTILGWELVQEATVLVALHQEPDVNFDDPEKALAYWRGKIDPALSKEGISEAHTMFAKMPKGAHLWLCGEGKRFYETAEIYNGGQKEVIFSSTSLGPAMNHRTPDEVIREWAVSKDYNLLCEAYLQDNACHTDTKVAVFKVGTTLKSLRGGEEPTFMGIVTDETTARLLRCWFLDVEPGQFMDDQFALARGEFLLVTIRPNGVAIIKPPYRQG